MKIIIDTDIDQVVILHKKTLRQFIFNESLIYLSQIMVFFWVAFLISNSLKNEDALVKFIDTKFNNNSVSEVGHIILATLITLGILTLIAKAVPPTGWLEELAEDVLSSISRTIYFFGSSVTGSILTVALFSKLNPSDKNSDPVFWLSLSLVFGVGAFIYGCATSYMFKHKKFIIKKSKKENQQAPTKETS